MAQQPGYTVLPVSALQDQASTVFEALDDGRTVYVSNRGKVVAAFRPYVSVPAAVAALYTSPNLDQPAVTSRDLRRGVKSSVVAEAAAGLPSLLFKDGRIHGVLTAASTPEPTEIPNPDAVGAKAEVMRQYREEHPDATIDEVLAYSDSLDTEIADAVVPDWEFESDTLLERLLGDTAAVRDDLEAWRDQGSDVEDVAEWLLLDAAKAIPSYTDPAKLLDAVRVPPAVLASYGTALEPQGRVGLIGGEQFEAAGDVVLARRRYVAELTDGTVPNVGAMWLLGSLARHQGRPAEARHWYVLSFVVDRLGQRQR